MKIYVKTFAGNTIVVEVESEATVAELKKEIEKATGESSEKFKLVSRISLEDEKLVGFYELEKMATLHMVFMTGLVNRKKATKTIRVKVPEEQIIRLEVEAYDTIEDLMKKIQEEGVSTENHKLTFVERLGYGPTELASNSRVEDYSFPEDCTLQLESDLNSEDIKSSIMQIPEELPDTVKATNGISIFVKGLEGRTIEVEIELTDTIGKLKEKIAEREKVFVENQKLIFLGQELENDKEIGFYENIAKGEPLHLALNLKAGQNSINFNLPNIAMFPSDTSLLQKLDNIVNDYISHNQASSNSTRAGIERANRIKADIVSYSDKVGNERASMAEAIINALKMDFEKHNKTGHMYPLSLNSCLLAFRDLLVSDKNISNLCLNPENVIEHLGLNDRNEDLNKEVYEREVLKNQPNTNKNCQVM